MFLPTIVLIPLAWSSKLWTRSERPERRARGLRMAAWVQGHWGAWTRRAFGLRVKTEGQPPKGAYLIASNHLSYLDILVLSGVFPSRFVAKSEIAGWPVIGPVAASTGTLFLVQADPRDVLRIGDAMRETLDAGVSVTLFPEGAASRGERVEPFHPALFAGPAKRGIPCLPVALSYRALRSPEAEAITVCWWGEMSLPTHIWRLLNLGPVEVTVRWGDELLVEADRKRLVARAQAEVEGLFQPVRQEPWPERGPFPRVD